MTRTHAILDETSREFKARKIEYLSTTRSPLKRDKMLEVGSGSGFIVSYFSKLGYGSEGSFAVDVADERQVVEGYQFQKVNDVVLPFEDNWFDLVISNHVVEHVGPRALQQCHVNELYRCLQSQGTLYFAVPNRWRLIEPHYKLPFLSWLPKRLASKYLKVTRSVSEYDCNPLSRREAFALLSDAGFEVEDRTVDAIPVTGQIEGNRIVRFLTSAPRFIWYVLGPIMPTLIYVCRKP